MGGFRQWIKKLFKSKPDRILRKPFEDVKEFYTIHEVLGSGTYAVTYRCTEKSTDKSYACKTISKMRNNEMMKKISDADHKKNIRREIEIMQLLSGRPNIVGFKSVHEDEKFVHLVMDLCASGELLLNRQYDEHDAARICRQIVEAVHACHSIHVIHRDVKPQNLLFSTIDHRNALLKLSDFGVSVFTKEGRYEEDTVGTAPYIAPEVLDHRYGKEADMWSTGVILYSLLSGELPFQGGPTMDKAIKEGRINLETGRWPRISQDAKDLLSKMLTRNPKDRITAAQALAHPWIRSYGGRRKSLKKKLLELITIKKLKELARKRELNGILKDYVGRENPLYFAERLTEHYKRPNGEGPHIYLKREDLNHTGAHKINNAVAQALLAKRLGKKRIIAETGAGQHGVATATVCARFGLECIIYMGAQDMERQALNVFRMRLLGAEVRAVHSGTATLKDATSEAIRDWMTNVETTHYILGSVAGPHPYPMMVREFHSMIGKETRKQALEKWGGKPDVLVACVGRGSNAMGLFTEFVDDKDVRLIGVEAAGFGLDSGKHAATLSKGEVGVLHGAMSYLLQDDDGQIVEPHSISAGLDYPGVGPEHSYLKDLGRAEYHSVTDEEALEAFKRVSRLEGIIPALETSHALAYLEKLCPTLPDGAKVVINFSGRGDKDIQTAIKYLKV